MSCNDRLVLAGHLDLERPCLPSPQPTWCCEQFVWEGRLGGVCLTATLEEQLSDSICLEIQVIHLIFLNTGCTNHPEVTNADDYSALRSTH